MTEHEAPTPSDRSAHRRRRPGRRLVAGVAISVAGVGLLSAGVAAASNSSREPEARGRIAEGEAPRGQDGSTTTIVPPTTALVPAPVAPATTMPATTMPATTAAAAPTPVPAIDDHGVDAADHDRGDDRGDDRGHEQGHDRGDDRGNDDHRHDDHSDHSGPG